MKLYCLTQKQSLENSKHPFSCVIFFVTSLFLLNKVYTIIYQEYINKKSIYILKYIAGACVSLSVQPSYLGSERMSTFDSNFVSPYLLNFFRIIIFSLSFMLSSSSFSSITLFSDIFQCLYSMTFFFNEFLSTDLVLHAILK